MIIDKDSKHFYIPNTQELGERNEYLNQKEYLNFEKKFPSEAMRKKPHINRISRDLAKNKRNETEILLSNTGDPQKEYEQAIKSISGDLENAIKEADPSKKGRLNFEEICNLLIKLKGEPINSQEINEIANELWNFMHPLTDTIDYASIYDVLIILLSSNNLSLETTIDLIREYARSAGLIQPSDLACNFFDFYNSSK